MKTNEYKCAMCDNIYEKTWTDEEAMNECNETFGEIDVKDCVIICDDCFNEINPAQHPQKVKDAITEINTTKQ